MHPRMTNGRLSIPPGEPLEPAHKNPSIRYEMLVHYAGRSLEVERLDWLKLPISLTPAAPSVGGWVPFILPAVDASRDRWQLLVTDHRGKTIKRQLALR